MYIQVNNEDSGEWGWGDLLIHIPICNSGDRSSLNPFSNRWIFPQVCGECGPIATPSSVAKVCQIADAMDTLWRSDFCFAPDLGGWIQQRRSCFFCLVRCCCGSRPNRQHRPRHDKISFGLFFKWDLFRLVWLCYIIVVDEFNVGRGFLFQRRVVFFHIVWQRM
jgi:hypothetical protein